MSVIVVAAYVFSAQLSTIASTIRRRCDSCPPSGAVGDCRTLVAFPELRCFCINANSSSPTGFSGPRVQMARDDPHKRIRQFLLTSGGGPWNFVGCALLLAAAGSRRFRVVRELAGVVELEPQRVDHRADHQRQAEHVEPEQGDKDEAEGRAEAGETGHVGEIDRE